ncbi:MAG: SAM-dependent methyltransferase, partial [Acidobacteriaceae bacterium]
LAPSQLPGGIGFMAMDVSFIGASLVLPAVIAAAFPPLESTSETDREAVVLVKPQYEAGREFVGKRGVVKDAAAHQLAIDRVRDTVQGHGGKKIAVIDSPIPGGEGNREFLLYARF